MDFLDRGWNTLEMWLDVDSRVKLETSALKRKNLGHSETNSQGTDEQMN